MQTADMQTVPKTDPIAVASDPEDDAGPPEAGGRAEPESEDQASKKEPELPNSPASNAPPAVRPAAGCTFRQASRVFAQPTAAPLPSEAPPAASSTPLPSSTPVRRRLQGSLRLLLNSPSSL